MDTGRPGPFPSCSLLQDQALYSIFTLKCSDPKTKGTWQEGTDVPLEQWCDRDDTGDAKPPAVRPDVSLLLPPAHPHRTCTHRPAEPGTHGRSWVLPQEPLPSKTHRALVGPSEHSPPPAAQDRHGPTSQTRGPSEMVPQL